MKSGKNKGMIAVLLASVIAISTLVAIAPAAVIATPDDYIFVDLSPYVNENWYDHSYSPDELYTDTILYSVSSGTPFKIFTNDDKYRIVLNGNWHGFGEDKPSVVSINFQDVASEIHFFGHCHIGMPTTEIHAKYVIHYEDGSSIEIPLNGDPDSQDYNIDDWCCNWWNKNLTKAVVAWEGTIGIWDGNPSKPSKNPLFREFIWQNPYPTMKITSIDFVDTGTVQCPQLLAITYKKAAPTITITTDKFKYCPDDPMTISIDIANPTEDSVAFQWYWVVPQFSVCVPVMSVPIPAGYDDTVNFSFTIPNWGSTPFGNVFYVQLIDASSAVLDADVIWWAYSPSGEAMPAAKVDIAEQIRKTIEKIE